MSQQVPDTNNTQDNSTKLLKNIVIIMGIIMIVGFVLVISSVIKGINKTTAQCKINDVEFITIGKMISWQIAADGKKLYVMTESDGKYTLEIKDLCNTISIK